MPDREKVLKALEHHKETAVCNGCPYAEDSDTAQGYCPVYDDAIALLKEQEALAAHQRDEFMRSWRTIKFSVMDTANNNAGDGNEDIYRILTWVATMMDQQEAKWNA